MHGRARHLLANPRFPELADDVVIEFCCPLGSVTDGGLYLGQASDLTMSHPDPAIYLDQAYWAELQRRNILQGGVSDLNALRQEQSSRFTLQAVPPSLLCS